ncbi:Uncharacterised protein [Bordetella pertussis]|nr:Uncharacterised protein [Bordetella pertussis]
MTISGRASGSLATPGSSSMRHNTNQHGAGAETLSRYPSASSLNRRTVSPGCSQRCWFSSW